MLQTQYFEVGLSADPDELRRRLVDFAHDMDFGLVSSMLVVDPPGQEPQFHYVGNRPEVVHEVSSDAELSKRDPVLQRLRRQSVPFAYDQKFFLSSGAPELWEIYAAHGYKTGIAVALHLPQHRHFLLGMDRDRPLPSSEVKLTRLLADLQFLAVHCQDAAVRLLDVPQGKSQIPRFSARELEILKWTMHGKTKWEIGKILSVSENTIKFHVKNVTLKLGVTSSRAAAMRAVSMGLI